MRYLTTGFLIFIAVICSLPDVFGQYPGISMPDWEKEYTFDLDGKELIFKVVKPEDQLGRFLITPNGDVRLMIEGIWVGDVGDIVQSPDGSIFLIGSSHPQSFVEIYNGCGFYRILEIGDGIQRTCAKSEDGSVMAYAVSREDSGNFGGLVIFSSGSWRYYPYEYDEDENDAAKESAEELKIIGSEIQIKHYNWSENTPQDVTYLSLGMFKAYYHTYAEGKDPHLTGAYVAEAKTRCNFGGQTYDLVEKVYVARFTGDRLTVEDSTGHFAAGRRSVYLSDGTKDALVTLIPTIFKSAPTEDSSATLYEFKVVAGNIPQSDKDLMLQEIR